MDIFIKVLKLCLNYLSKDDKPNQGQGQQQQQQPQHQQNQGAGGGGQYGSGGDGNYPPHKQQPHHQQQPHYPSQGQGQQHGGGGGGGGKYQGRIDANQQNQHDPKYLDLRNRARSEGDKMAHSFDASHRAYESGDGARAKDLSAEGNRHKAEMERLNHEASDWIYYQNNTDSAVDEVDLHGLYVAEAITRTEQAIQTAQSQGKDHLDIIVGKGLHSPGHVAKLKPAIEDLMAKYRLEAHLDPHNAGVLIVNLNSGGQGGGQRGIGSDEITRRLDNNDQDCVIM